MDAEQGLKLLETAKSYWGSKYSLAEEDMLFSIGQGHWEQKDKNKREKKGKPCLVVNQLPQFIHQVVNDMKMNTPSINILPIDDDADIETAKIIKGLIRNIEYRSNADTAYDIAGDYAVRCSIGFIRIDHDYISPSSDLQELLIKPVKNPLAVYLDPNSVESDGSDAEWAIVLDTITKEQFEKRYPGREFVSFDDKNKDRKEEENITIAELFIKEYSATQKDELEDKEIIGDAGKPRELKKVTIGRYRLSGEGAPLESSRFPGIYIPVVPVYGEEVWIDGERHLLSLIRQAKDAQRRVNYWASKEIEILSMAPVAPVMAAVGQTEDFKQEWGAPGDYNVLRYKQTDISGAPAPKPERLNAPAVPTGIINAMDGAKENIKETLGMYPASLGQKSNAISGVAYNAQKEEGDVATFHFTDNRNRSIQQCGRVLVSAIPEVYDTPRNLQIINEEESPETVAVNGNPWVQGQERNHDLTKGQYDVRVTLGASYTTKRQEAAQLMSDAFKANPQLMGVIGDLYFKTLDVAGAEAISARIKKTIPKELVADEDKENPQDPEKMQMAQVIEQLQAQLQQVGAELQSKQSETQLKQAELGLKDKELGIKAMEAQAKANQPAPVVDNSQTLIKIKELELEQEQFNREMRLKEMEFELQAQKTLYEVIQAQQVQMQPQIEPTENEVAEDINKQQTNETLAGIQATIQSLIAAISQPIEITRDENGAITGAR